MSAIQKVMDWLERGMTGQLPDEEDLWAVVELARKESVQAILLETLIGQVIAGEPKVTHEQMAGPQFSDQEVAGRVRMLMRTDLDHEMVCTLARDRIQHLSRAVYRLQNRVAELERVDPENS